MTLYSDAYLEHYADRFIALRLARHGVNLAQYLAHPERYEARALEPEPPLAAQRAVALRLWWGWDTGLAPRGDGGEATGLPENWQDWRELLAQWRADAEAAEREVAHLPRRNGAVIEPLHHHRYERRNNSNFSKRGA
ncbi:hypothetical protein [Billgrantia gudaonensis]|uniref:Uncharacterized protein n=1 Tax=Billgrantia gudaonensis TaxID=376427 RepID=A0A1G9AVJ1_9GAMM|nr:hypothetical protein [Halomonas gudaonensis]SDK30924.1 hypothetical protein SAMN04487954_11495 [Halomonas gudaonensis]